MLNACAVAAYRECCPDDVGSIKLATQCRNGSKSVDSSSCRKYFECVDQKIVSKTCEANQRFDFDTKNCVPDSTC